MQVNLPTTAAVVFLLVSSGARAQPPSAPHSQRGLDLIALRNGPALMGAVAGATSDGSLRIVVERDWLRAAQPAFYEQVVKDETATTRRALEELLPRIALWKERRPEEQNLTAFLTLEEQRVRKALGELENGPAEDQTQLIWVALAPADVRRVVRQTPERKQIALLAWRERLPDVATESVGSLERKLRERNVAITAEQVDLSDRLPLLPQDEREWAARVALVEHHFVKRFELQGTGTALAVIGGEQPAITPELIGEIYRAEVAKLLDEVAGAKALVGDSWIDEAVRRARQRKFSAVRVTRVDPDLTRRRVTVESRFLAELPGGAWETIWSHREVADAGRPRPELEQRIRKDPQIQQVLKTFQGAGLAVENSIAQALQFGAATIEAQEKANGNFQQFQDRYLRRLDGPPLSWR